MPTPSRLRSTAPAPLATRARYARTAGDMLTGGVNPSDSPPALWWWGYDSGGGAYPIGPNGPWSTGDALPVVVRATSLICGPLTAAPFRVLEAGFAGDPQVRPRWLMDPMLLRPDARFVDSPYPAVAQLPRGQFWDGWIRSAVWWGLGAFVCQTDESGQPLAGTLRLLDGRLLSTRRDEAGALRWVLGADQYGSSAEAVFDRDGYLSLGPITYRIVVLRNPHGLVDAEGMSAGVFAQSPSAFQLAEQVDTYSSGTFRSGVPNGYLKVDQSMSAMTDEQAERLKAKWMAAHGGDRRSIAVLNAFTEFVPVNLSPVDAALGEVKRLSIADVAYAFGLDPEVLGTSLANSSTYRNAQEFWGRHRDFGLAPWISGVQDVLSSLLPGSQSVLVNMDGFASPPAGERFAAYEVALRAGILSVAEVRQLEGMPPMAELPDVQPPPLAAVPEPEPEAEEATA